MACCMCCAVPPLVLQQELYDSFACHAMPCVPGYSRSGGEAAPRHSVWSSASNFLVFPRRRWQFSHPDVEEQHGRDKRAKQGLRARFPWHRPFSFHPLRHRSFLPSLVSPHLTWLAVVSLTLTLTLLSEPVRPCTERNLGVDDGSGSGSVPTVVIPIHHRDARTAEWRIRMRTSLAKEVLVNHHSCKMKPRHPRVNLDLWPALGASPQSP